MHVCYDSAYIDKDRQCDNKGLICTKTAFRKVSLSITLNTSPYILFHFICDALQAHLWQEDGDECKVNLIRDKRC